MERNSERNSEKFVIVGPQHPERPAIESFIRGVFAKSYGARVEHFAEYLLGVRARDGQWAAALGYTPAQDHRLFLENYGGGNVERQIADKLAAPVDRKQIVEVGNMAANSAGAARRLIICSIQYLYEAGFSWVTFTATRCLLNSFARLDLRPLALADADPARLPDQGRSWGTYYDTRPQIMAGSILLGYTSMHARHRAAARAL